MYSRKILGVHCWWFLAPDTPGRAFPGSLGVLTGPVLALGMPSYLAGLGHAPKLLVFPLLNQGLSLFGPLHRPAHSQHGFQGLPGRPAVDFLLLEENPSKRDLQSTPLPLTGPIPCEVGPHSGWGGLQPPVTRLRRPL